MCNDLFDENEHFLDFEMLKRKFNIHTNYLTYMGVRQAVLSDLKKFNFIRNEVFKSFIPFKTKTFSLHVT